MTSFHAYTTTHGLAVLACLLFVLVFLRTAYVAARRSARTELCIRVTWILSIIAVQTSVQVWALVPENFDVRRTLPLHICDFAPWIGIAALMLPTRSLKSVAYFWGVGLTVWAFIKPALSWGPAVPQFWFFWTGHMQTIATGLYLVLVLQFRPTWRDLGVAALVTALYTALILPIDIWLSADYGFVGPESIAAAILGPWPLRALIVLLGELFMFIIVLTPWLMTRQKPSAADDSGVDTVT